MDLTFQVPMQYCSLQHWTLLLSPHTSTTGCCFCSGSITSFFLELFLHWSPVSYWAPTNLFQCPIILPFHTVHGVLKARILKWFAVPFSSGPHSVRPLHHDSPILGGPTGHVLVSLSSTRLWSMWLDWLVFYDYGLCVCPLMPLATPTITYSNFIIGKYGRHQLNQTTSLNLIWIRVEQSSIMFFLKQYLEKDTLYFSNIPAITHRCTNTIIWIKYKEIADKYTLNWHSTKYQAYSIQNIKVKKEKVEEQLQNRDR